MSEEDNKALNAEAEQINSRNSTPELEPKTTEEVEPAEAAVATETEAETTDTAGEPAKKGYQARVQELNQRAKDAEEKAKSLEQKLAELTQPNGLPEPLNVPQYDPQAPVVQPGEEIDIAELNKRISEREVKMLQQANANATLMQKQSEAINRINAEANEVIRTYPELDPDSDNFNKELSDSITEATEAYVKSSPYSASVKGFVAKLMKPYQGAVNREVGKATENIAKQVSEAAIRPTSIRKEEKTAAEKSIAELEQELGIVQA